MSERVYLTVTALNKYLERKFVHDPYLKEIYLKGEVSNCKLHTNGTLYFSIKDSNTRINALKFNSTNVDIKDGDNVLIKAELNFYFPYGNHRLIVYEIKKDSIGDLFQKYIELKDKLQGEGIFSQEHKKLIKKFNKNIAVITASSGAAIQDIKRTITRRYPLAEINIYSSLVQGENATDDIIKNLKLADEQDNDVIILARGGGSIEDLWSFNSELLVREIFNCKTPIITGIGHETDTTLADFVADVRASTPTAAAEIVTSVTIEDLKNHLLDTENLISKLIVEKINFKKNMLSSLANTYQIRNFEKNYHYFYSELENYSDKLNILIKNTINIKKDNLIKNKELLKRLDIIEKYKSNYYSLVDSLENNSPINILKKGYAIVKDKEGRKISSVADLSVNDEIKISVKDGDILARVDKLL
ncbi:exodeoxyribonuclease VII large subunit [Gemella sp. zg-1178]|uniref:exodeoxyribonuclease VII large subunit n=1 Tax=Gemella sp. zg-1178 TaxID=2840372 RepID=UPI001C05471B|nr:exodeoxyribonuclease VII large subunit [Gemella sp. zg-1178]MBU0278270.1 exodeoxyribonuclease VII large subunit [Gemella sp. zg-1178]